MDTKLTDECYCGIEICSFNLACHNSRAGMHGGSAGSACIVFANAMGNYGNVVTMPQDGLCAFGDKIEFCRQNNECSADRGCSCADLSLGPCNKPNGKATDG